MIRTLASAAGPATRRVLCIDDDADYLTILTMALRMPGVFTVTAASAEEGTERLRSEPFDLILTDIQMPGQSGFEFIRTARTEGFTAPILVLTAQGSIEGAVEALKLGARDYLTKPIDPERLRRTVAEILRDAVAEVGQRDVGDQGAQGFQGMLGVSARMTEVFDRIRRIARTDATVLVVGESGTGKELVSRAIHNCSNRTDGPFVPVHTGAIPRELIASELFGHERGSFTGAIAAADGKFDAAMKGTLFLDEIGTTDLAVQVTLLRVLETFRFTRVGGRKERIADVRVLAATNRDMAEMVREGTFREDLYYRLNVFSIAIPPLRDRPEDIPALAEHYLRRFAERHNSPARVLSAGALDRLMLHPWPGNVRELRNVMERTAVFAQREEVLGEQVQITDALRAATPGRLPTSVHPLPAVTPPPSGLTLHPPAEAAVPSMAPGPGTTARGTGPVAVASQGPHRSASPEVPQSNPQAVGTPEGSSVLAAAARARLGAVATSWPDDQLVIQVSVGTTVEATERALILRTLEVIGGNKQKAARILGISRRCLYNKLASYGISTSPVRDGVALDDHDDPDPH